MVRVKNYKNYPEIIRINKKYKGNLFTYVNKKTKKIWALKQYFKIRKSYATSKTIEFSFIQKKNTLIFIKLENIL